MADGHSARRFSAGFVLLFLSLFWRSADISAQEPVELPVLTIYSEDRHPAWAHQDLTFHFLLQSETGDAIDYEIPDPSKATVWRSTDFGENWYDITGSPDASLSKDSLIITNLDENVLDLDAGGQGYFFQIELPKEGPVARYSNIFKVLLLDKETLLCYSNIGGDRGGGNRHPRDPDVTQPPGDIGNTDSVAPDIPETPDSDTTETNPSTDYQASARIPDEELNPVPRAEDVESNPGYGTAAEDPGRASKSTGTDAGNSLPAPDSRVDSHTDMLSSKELSSDHEPAPGNTEADTNPGQDSRDSLSAYPAVIALAALATGLCAGIIRMKKRKS